MYQLILNPNNMDHKVFVEFLAHQFEDLPYIEIVPVHNINTLILMKDNDIIAKNIEEVTSIFQIEKFDDNPKAEKVKTATDIAKEWQQEQEEEKDDFADQYARNLKDYEDRRKMVNDRHTIKTVHTANHNGMDLNLLLYPKRK